MRRKTFDLLVSVGGTALAVVLVVAGALLLVAHSYATTNVHDQLDQQQIFFPEAGSDSLKDDQIGPYLTKYAGQQLLTGEQAKAYADHYIAVHLSEMPLGGVYSKVSAASRADPTNEDLKAEVQTSFQGTTLRGLLLEAYAFSTFGKIALWAAIASFVGAGVMALLSALGFWHWRRVPPEAEI
jgi:hypothetical protein